ncbi:hypothetical protein HWV62_8227 [Athelia sp. TMB]|nr:hypothetical protein HWV62_8227 [Athelia sp. TMB]
MASLIQSPLYNKRLLPVELFAKIFEHACLDDGPVEVKPDSMPLVLSQVSRAFRQLALESSNIWSSLRIDPPYPSPAYIATVEAWILKSKGRPLTLEVILADGVALDDNIPSSPGAEMAATERRIANGDLLEVIYAQAPRWHTVTLDYEDADSGSLLSAPLAHGEWTFCKLKTFILYTAFEEHDPDDPGDHDVNRHLNANLHLNAILARAPLLSQFTWRDPIITRERLWNALELPFDSLRELELRCSMSPEELVDIVSKCPRLECAFLCADMNRHPLGLKVGLICHKNLKNLAIKQSPTTDDSLYQLLHLPSLEKLEVFSLDSSSADLISFLKRHHFLSELELHCELESVAAQELEDLLRALPSVLRLTLDNTDEEADFRTRVDAPQDEEADFRTRVDAPQGTTHRLVQLLSDQDVRGNFLFCPHLHAITLSNLAHWCEDDRLVDFVQRRHRAFPDTARIFMRPVYVLRDTFVSLQELGQQGVPVDIEWHTLPAVGLTGGWSLLTESYGRYQMKNKGTTQALNVAIENYAKQVNT